MRDASEPDLRVDDADPSSGWPAAVAGLLLVLWSCYSLNGFRGWWVPVEVSDTDAGSAVRQALFGGSALAAGVLLWRSGLVWTTVRSQWRLGVLAAWLLLTSLYSDLAGTTMKRAILFACGTVTASAVVALAEDPLERIGRLVVAITGVAAFMSIAWAVVLPAEITTNPGRPGLAGISNHPNTLGAALAIGLVMSVGLPVSGRRASLARWLAGGGCGVALIMTGSVTSFGIAVVGLLTYASLMAPVYWKSLAGLVTLGVAGAFVLLGPDRLFSDLLGTVGRDTSMSGRSALWSIIWAEVQQAPVFGRGWGAFWTEGKGRELVGTWNPRQSHNAYLDVLLDVGVIGFMMFSLVLIPMFWTLARRLVAMPAKGHRGSICAMLAVLVSLLAVYGLQQSFLGRVDAFAFIVVLLICAAAARTDATDRITRPSAAPDRWDQPTATPAPSAPPAAFSRSTRR